MIINQHGDWETEEEASEEELPLVSDDGELAEEGELLVARRILSAQMVEEEDDQRENLFHTRCQVQGKVCSVIIDGGSCSNVASTELVEKLGLPVFRHRRPYRLQWLNECGELKVTKQVKVLFSIGKYKDEVLCDVVPMRACHLLLGRPWQFDRRVTHDGFLNRYSFVLRGEPITLLPLTPKQVLEEQVMREKRRKNESEKMSGEEKLSEERKEREKSRGKREKNEKKLSDKREAERDK